MTQQNEYAVLPTRTTINPANPTDAEYYDVGQTALVLHKAGRSRPTRVVTSYGTLAVDEWLGRSLELRHDQTLARLGTYVVVGVHVFSTGVRAGEVPNRKIQHAVFK